METLKGGLLVPLAIVWGLAGPITYVLSVVDTWHARISVFWKLLISITLDAMLATIWPITWSIWGVRWFLGGHTPLDLIF